MKRQSNYSEFDKEEDSLTSKIYILWVSSFSLCAGGDGVEPSYLPHRWKCSKVQIFQQKTLPSFHRRQVRMETRLLKTNKFVTKCYFIQIWCQCKKCNLILPFEITLKPSHFWRNFLGGENIDFFTKQSSTQIFCCICSEIQKIDILLYFIFCCCKIDILLYLQWSLENWWSNAATNWIGPEEDKIFEQKCFRFFYKINLQ